MIGYTARLTRGGYSLDISTGRYSLAQFTPPTATEIVNVAGGLSSNRTQGSQLAGRRAVNGQVSFVVRVLGASQAEVDAGGNDLAHFLRLAGDEAEPLYLEFCPHGYVTFAPKWGQDQWRRLEIVHAETYKSDLYFLADIRSKAQMITVEAEIKPYIFGIRQRLAAAVGGVFEDYIGSPTGLARGLRVPEATTNKATNPIFGHATFGNGWTAGANVTATANYDKRFILFGRVSAKLVSVSGSANHTYTQSLTLTVATYTGSAYIKKADGSAVTSSDVVIYEADGGETASTYQALGDGWYRVWASWTGAASAKAIGIALNAVGAGVYLAGFQVEALAYPTLICHGDMMGCSWAGTAHASASSRTAASLAVDTYASLNVIEGTVRVVMEMDCTQTSGNFRVFQHFIAAAFLDCYYLAADDKFYLTDGTNTISSAAQTFAVGDKIVLHATWKAGALNLYKAGANIATGATYTPPLGTGNLYIGAANDATENLRGLILGFETWDRAMSATEVANDYANVYQIAADGGRVSCLPWVYNTTTIDMENDLVVIGGIPGSVDADTTLDIAHETTTGPGSYDLYINLNPMPRFSGLTSGGANYIYRDLSGAVLVGGTDWVDSANPLFIDYEVEQYLGKRAWIITDIADSETATLYIAAGCWVYYTSGDPPSGTYTVGPGKVYSTSSSSLVRLVGPVRLPTLDKFNRSHELQVNMQVGASLYITTASGTGTRNVTPDWYALLVDRLTWIPRSVAASDGVRINGRTARNYNGTLYTETSAVLGDLIELSPGQINHMMIILNNIDAGDSNTTVDITEISIIPRWLMS